jgi:DNA polymerase-3 subunit epsilon
MSRRIVLDTETTGLDPAQGHRIIEIAAVVINDRKITDQYFHCYLNPERAVDAGAFAVHGLSDTFLADKPVFSEIIQEFLKFVANDELIIHNAPFDLGFIQAEFDRLGYGIKFSKRANVTDTLQLARKKHPGQKNNLDALCKRYGVDNRHRELHGALLDARILAQVYLAMTGGQGNLFSDLGEDTTQRVEHKMTEQTLHQASSLHHSIVQHANANEIAEHLRYLEMMKKVNPSVLFSEFEEV